MVRRREPAPLSARQIEIMNIVWSQGKATVAEVWEAMSAQRKVARNTIQTLMTRLEEKGWLGHLEDGPAFRYFARRRREATLRGMLEQMVNTVFAGSADSLVMALLESRGVSPDEAERIRAMIAQAEASQAERIAS
jgi:predicted transcriptional regulator